jgi:hypothetical protein
MKPMLWLIKKELTANVRYTLIGFGIFLAYVFIFSANGAGLFTLCLTIFIYLILSANLALDERYQIDRLLTTLPIRRRDMVFSKYLLIDVLFAVSVLLYAALTAVSALLGFDRIPPITFLSAMLGLFVASAYGGVTIPLCYRFGAQSTRYVSFVLFFVVFALSPMLPAGAAFASEAGFSDGLAGAALLVGAFAAQAASFLASNALFAKKDL